VPVYCFKTLNGFRLHILWIGKIWTIQHRVNGVGKALVTDNKYSGCTMAKT